MRTRYAELGQGLMPRATGLPQSYPPVYEPMPARVVDGAQDARGSGEDRGSPPNLFTK